MKSSSRRNCNSRRPALASTLSCLNEVQLPKELQRCVMRWCGTHRFRLNEVQLPKELQLGGEPPCLVAALASMKCSSRRNCNPGQEHAHFDGTRPQ